MFMHDDVVRFVARHSPSRHLISRYTNAHRQRIKAELRRVECQVHDVHFSLNVNTGDIHGYLCWMYGELEPELSSLIRYLLPHTRVFLDIGANVGYYSILAATVNPECQIVAFEPAPTTCARLRDNVRLNGSSHIQVEQVALGINEGTVQFEVYEDPAFNAVRTPADAGHPFFTNSQVIDVPCIRLDDYLDKHGVYPDVVKMDVEGFEYNILRGAPHLLSGSQAPILFCEVEPLWLKRFGFSSTEIFDYLKGFGYECFALTPLGLLPRTDSTMGASEFVFAKSTRVDELKRASALYDAGWRKIKARVKSALRPVWRRLRTKLQH